MRGLRFVVVLAAWAGIGVARAQGLPPVPVPPENPITEPKRALGKILFWDEQLSADDTVACGACHMPGQGGTDPRIAIHPGPDGIAGTADDIKGSPGVVHADAAGKPVEDPLFAFEVQVTRRSANATIGAAYSPLLFWDGRAGSTFLDPITGGTRVANGGALENQALGPILSTVEMGTDDRSWSSVTAKISRVVPLGNATSLPADVSSLLAAHPTYPELFQEAFGDPAITPDRIAFAIATYERTLVADDTPWDRFVAGNAAALTPGQQQGWNFFRNSPCAACHAPPTFTNHTFRNIGVRPPPEDTGRREVTGQNGDRGRFKVPTLRNVSLKKTFFHNGSLATIPEVVAFYRPNNPARFLDNIDPIFLPPGNGIGVPPQVLPALLDFLTNGLTDPRVAAETFPFDRPVLHGGQLASLSFSSDRMTLQFPALSGVLAYAVYRGSLAGLVDGDGDGLPDGGYGDCVSGSDPNPSDTVFVDPAMPASGEGFFYLKGVVDGSGVRGLGATSAGKPRVAASPCP